MDDRPLLLRHHSGPMGEDRLHSRTDLCDFLGRAVRALTFWDCRAQLPEKSVFHRGHPRPGDYRGARLPALEYHPGQNACDGLWSRIETPRTIDTLVKPPVPNVEITLFADFAEGPFLSGHGCTERFKWMSQRVDEWRHMTTKSDRYRKDSCDRVSYGLCRIHVTTLPLILRRSPMGAEPWSSYTPFDANLQQALDNLRRDVFASGDYRYAEEEPSSIEEALEIADADGTCSILDIQRISDEPDYCCAAPFSTHELITYFGSERPTRAAIEAADDYWEELRRGQARYVIVYANEQPSEIYFAGYSFD